MFKNRVIFLFLFLVTIQVFSQKSISVVYKVSPLNGTYENSEIIKSSPNKNHYLGVDEALNKISYELLVSDTIATFRILQTLDFSTRENRMAKNVSGGIEYFAQKNSLYYFSDLIGERFKVKVENLVWETTKETQIISGYKCYKAIAKKYNPSKRINKYFDIIAWFCPSIPISYGPKESIGLPGLVLQYQDDKVVFLAEKINFQSDKRISSNFNKKYKEIWEAEYSVMVKEKTLKFYYDKL